MTGLDTTEEVKRDPRDLTAWRAAQGPLPGAEETDT